VITRGPNERGGGLWPLLYSSWQREPGGTPRGFTYLFPLFFYRRAAEGFSLFTPLAAYQRDGDARSLWALLYYGARSGGEASHYLFPLFYHQKRHASELSVLAPLYVGYKRGPLKVRVGLPLIVDVTTAAGRAQIYTPLFIHTRGYKAERWRVAFLWSFTRYNEEYRRATAGGEAAVPIKELRLFPFVSYTKDDAQSYRWKALLLFGFERNVEAGVMYRRLFLFGVPIRLKDKPAPAS
jgi:hypothetical protein